MAGLSQRVAIIRYGDSPYHRKTVAHAEELEEPHARHPDNVPAERLRVRFLVQPWWKSQRSASWMLWNSASERRTLAGSANRIGPNAFARSR
jgi:hypothetical protein